MVSLEIGTFTIEEKEVNDEADRSQLRTATHIHHLW